MERGKFHATVDTGLSVIACKKKGRRIDVDADDLIYHLKVLYSDTSHTGVWWYRLYVILWVIWWFMHNNNKTAQSNLRTGHIAAPRSREWTRLLCVLAVQCPLQTSNICWRRWTTRRCLMLNRPYHAAHNDRAGHRVYSAGDSICWYWQHFATQTVSCQLLAHTCMVMFKLHWFHLLSTCFTNKFATNPQQIEPVGFES